MPASNEFAADGRSTNEIAELINADKLFYQDLEDLVKSVYQENSDIKNFDSSCFDGRYVTGDVTKEYLEELDELRNNASKLRENITELGDDIMVY